MSFIYNLLLFLILVSSIYEFNTNIEPNKSWYKTIVVLMIFTAGLAYGISPDWVAYWRAFEDVSETPISQLKELSEYWDMEVGYIYLNKLVSFIGLGYGAFTLLLAAIALSLKTMTIFRYGGYVFLALLMYMVPTYFLKNKSMFDKEWPMRLHFFLFVILSNGNYGSFCCVL